MILGVLSLTVLTAIVGIASTAVHDIIDGAKEEIALESVLLVAGIMGMIVNILATGTQVFIMRSHIVDAN